MMKHVLGAGCLLAVLAGTAWAQSPPPATPTAPASATVPAPAAAGPAVVDDEGAGAPPRDRRPPPGGEADAGGPPLPPHGGKRPPPPPPSRAAHFHIERGDLALDVKCAEDEPMRVCADTTLQMLDRLNGMPPH